jgi:glucokinase
LTRVLDVPTDGRLAIGVDLGGIKIHVVVVDRDGGVVRRHRRPTNATRRPEAVLEDIVACIRDACLPGLTAPLATVGVGVAGQVARGTGVVRFAPNLGWRDVPLAERLADRVALPVAVLNDVQAAAYGEYRFGAGRGVRDIVCLFVGTGVGGGVIADGVLLQGCSGAAGELGHITVEPEGPQCRCGNRGCLEAFAGGWAIAERAREGLASGNGRHSPLLRLIDRDLGRLDAERVGEAARERDLLARRILDQAEAALAIGAGTIVNAFNPCRFVIGGGVADGLPGFVTATERGIRARALDTTSADVCVVRAALGGDAGALGAAEWARRVQGKRGR